MHSGVVLCCVDVHGCVMLVLAWMCAQWSCPVLCVVGFLHMVPDRNIQLLGFSLLIQLKD